MNQKKLVLCFFVIMVFCGCGRNNYNTDNLESLSRTYGLVRWFYPSDEAQIVDWDKLLIYGIEQVKDSRSSEELQRKLQDIFLPIAPGISFSNSPNHDNMSKITPPDTTGMEVVAWQHYGVDLGLMSNTYVSKRTNRPLQTQNVSKLAVDATLPAAGFIGKSVTITVDLKSNDDDDDFEVFFRTATSEGLSEYVSFCAEPEIEPLILTKEWKRFSRTIEIGENHKNSEIRWGIYTSGEGSFYLGNVTVLADGVNITNQFYLSRNYVVYDYEQQDKVLLVATRNKLFYEQARFGDVKTAKIGANLYVHVPLALLGTKNSTYPESNPRDFADLAGKLEIVDVNDVVLMYADIITTWNVIKYFQPYLSDLDVDWESQLRHTLSDVEPNSCYNSTPLRWMMGQIGDAHVSITTKDISEKEWMFLPFQLRMLNDELVITDAFAPEILQGDIIEFIEGKPAVELFMEYEKLFSGGPHFKAERAATRFLVIPFNPSEVRLSIRREGVIHDLILSTINNDEWWKSRDEGASSKWINDRLLYINLSTTDFDEVQSLLAGRDLTQNVIVDVRSGYRALFYHILPLLYGSHDHILSRQGISNIPQVFMPETPVIPDTLSNVSVKAPNKNVVYLTGQKIYSHGEEVLDYVRYKGLGRLVGTNTGGCNGRINTINLPSGGQVVFTGTKVFSNLGKDHYYYMKGITPDIYVEDTLDDIKNGRDAALEKAVELLNWDNI